MWGKLDGHVMLMDEAEDDFMVTPISLCRASSIGNDHLMNKDELIKELRKPDQFKEIWLKKDTGASICALINGDFGWLMYLHHANDFGFSSRNPEFESQEMIPFQLSNGQVDDYPKNWVYPVSVVKEALLYFLRHGQMYDRISWHDDSFG